ncbi:MAG: ATP-binding protein [Hasllibacter sp.]
MTVMREDWTGDARTRIGRPVAALLFACLLGAAFLLPDGPGRLAALSAGLAGLATVALTAYAGRPGRPSRALRALIAAFAHDPVPTVVTMSDGRIVGANPAAEALGDATAGHEIGRLLSARIADAGALCRALVARAEVAGHAEEELNTPGGTATLSAARASGGLVWRVGERLAPTEVPKGAFGFTTGRGGVILHLCPELRRLAGGRPRTVSELLEIGPDGLAHLRAAPETPYRLIEDRSAGGRRQVHLLPVPASDAPPARTADEPGEDLEAMFDSMPVPLLLVRPGGRVGSANRRARELLQFEPDESPLLRELVTGLGRSIDDWIADALDGRGLGHPEVLRARRPEKEVFVQITFDRQARPQGPVVVAHVNDATEFKTLEDQFVQGQKMQAIGQLAGGVAHDFNNLLTAISGHCDLLMLRHDHTDPDYADLVQINQNANRAAALVGQLLAFSRKQNLQPEVLDVRDTLADLTYLLNRLVGERVELGLRHADQLGCIRADKRQLEQVLMNLVVNARDALGGSGEIGIESRDLTLEVPLARDNAEVPPGDYVELRVIDAGCGIPPDRLSKIFEPFYTTKRPGEGTGLGLSTVYGIVKQTGGYIFVDSELGEGTSFQLLFPRHGPQAAEAPAVSEPDSGPAGDGVVLLVEDEAPVRNFAARALQLQGYQVLEAGSAEAALELLEDPGVEVDVFVTDVIMPGLDGPSWVRQALKQRPQVRVVFVSGYAEDALDGAAGAVPGSVFLPKPFSLNALVQTVAGQLKGRRTKARRQAAPLRPPEAPDLLTAAATTPARPTADEPEAGGPDTSALPGRGVDPDDDMRADARPSDGGRSSEPAGVERAEDAMTEDGDATGGEVDLAVANVLAGLGGDDPATGEDRPSEAPHGPDPREVGLAAPDAPDRRNDPAADIPSP